MRSNGFKTDFRFESYDLRSEAVWRIYCTERDMNCMLWIIIKVQNLLSPLKHKSVVNGNILAWFSRGDGILNEEHCQVHGLQIVTPWALVYCIVLTAWTMQKWLFSYSTIMSYPTWKVQMWKWGKVQRLYVRIFGEDLCSTPFCSFRKYRRKKRS